MAKNKPKKTFKLEEYQDQHSTSKKVVAILLTLDINRGYDFLTSQEFKKIFLLKTLLKTKNITEAGLTKGDEFEVEISKDDKGYKVDKILSYKPNSKLETENKPESEPEPIFENTKAFVNFSSFLHKRNRFWERDEGKERKKYSVKKIDVERVQTIIVDSKSQYKDVQLLDVFEKEMNGWQNSDFYEKLISRHEQNARQLTANQLITGKLLQFKPNWRLILGLGSGSVFETSITLHHIYGFPYIPSSAVKGVLRNYLVSLIWGNNPDSEAIAFRDSKLMCDIFGCPEELQYNDSQDNKKKMKSFYKKAYDEDHQQFGKDKSKFRFGITEKSGDMIFFDTYPIESPKGKIKTDIMNPHYPQYYNGKLPPADWQSPVPIVFLAVEDLSFQFMLGLQKNVENVNITLKDKSGYLLNVISSFLKDALTHHGIGAKTAVGYGYMNP